MFASKGIQLLKEMQRTTVVPSFNEDVVRVCVDEMTQLVAEIVQALTAAQNDPDMGRESDFSTKVLIYHTSLQRNKRICLAYLSERMERIKRIAWELGYIPERSKPNLVNAELDFFSDYTNLLRMYPKHFDRASVHIDLMEDLSHPPTDMIVEVRVLKNIGQVYTEDGAIYLEKGTQHTMRRAEAEPYIRQGKLEHIL